MIATNAQTTRGVSDSVAGTSAPIERIPLTHCRLAATVAAEDRAEAERGLSPHERITCRLHRRWVHQCIASPQHVIAVSGHRWCDECASAVTVAVDELTGSVELTCPRCARTPRTRANDQIIRTCEASLNAARCGYHAGRTMLRSA